MLIMMHYNMPLCLCQRLQVSGLLKEAVIRDVVWDGRKGCSLETVWVVWL